jgi:diadenosine tetraphosphatase ApaH/serine/threonine PP2A family protein phosphatase
MDKPTRYAVISDVHANYSALQAVDEDVRQLRTQGDEKIDYWFLGDLVGYGPDPVECIKWLKNRSNIEDRWVPGNHDEWLLQQTKVSEEAFTSLSAHKGVLEERLNSRSGKWFCDEVSAAIKDETRSLVNLDFPEQQLSAWFTHAAVWQTQRRSFYLRPWKPMHLENTVDLLKEEYKTRQTTVLFCGHTHFPMWYQDSNFRSIAYNCPLHLDQGVHIINPGSVGQPRDGDPRASYLLFNPSDQTIEFRRVEYDVTQVYERLLDGGYMGSLATRLRDADGRSELQEYRTIYKKPTWDLEAVNKKKIGGD